MGMLTVFMGNNLVSSYGGGGGGGDIVDTASIWLVSG